jgi:hypothetical protein
MLPVDFCPCSDNDVAAYFRSSESNQVGLFTHSMSDFGHSYELVGQSLKAQQRSMRGRFGRSVLWAQTTAAELLV